MIELALAVGLFIQQPVKPTETIDYREPFSIRVELMDSKIYPWVSIGKGSITMYGQGLSSVYNVGVGVGYRIPLTNKITLRAEAGAAYPIMKTNHVIQQEVAYTYLVDRHESEWRPIPVTPQGPYEQESYGTTWEVEPSAVIRVGADFELTTHLTLSFNLRFQNPKALIEIYDHEAKANGGGWWQEFSHVNQHTAELGLTWRF